MNLAAWFFETLLALSLLVVAWRVLAAAELFQAVVWFIAFGLLMALAWVRLAAPDVALAEAAIGAGLVGVLLLDAHRFMSRVARGGNGVQGAEPDH
jgi:energy-converting hydrogenase B subunit D